MNNQKEHSANRQIVLLDQMCNLENVACNVFDGKALFDADAQNIQKGGG